MTYDEIKELIPAYYNPTAGFKAGYNDRMRGKTFCSNSWNFTLEETAKFPFYWEIYLSDYSRGYYAALQTLSEHELQLISTTIPSYI